MRNRFEDTWEQYVASWKATGAEAKLALFEGCLDRNCEYIDPLSKARGWQELAASMVDFHAQIPGAHFVTTYFLAHNDKSIARWQMRDGSGAAIGEGISYGTYTPQGKLASMIGFFDTP